MLGYGHSNSVVWIVGETLENLGLKLPLHRNHAANFYIRIAGKLRQDLHRDGLVLCNPEPHIRIPCDHLSPGLDARLVLRCAVVVSWVAARPQSDELIGVTTWLDTTATRPGR